MKFLKIRWLFCIILLRNTIITKHITQSFDLQPYLVMIGVGGKTAFIYYQLTEDVYVEVHGPLIGTIKRKFTLLFIPWPLESVLDQ